MPAKHALIIGINKYPYLGAKYQLGGCVNDAKLLKTTLCNKFGFTSGEIVELFNEKASRDGILDAMEQLLRAVQKNDVVLFHYSGHGHRCSTKTKYTDEGSGKDNCILPSDDSKPKADGTADYREIRDNQFNAWLEKLAKKTANITLIFDACHSGTMTRSINPAVKVRGVPDQLRPRPAKKIGKTATRKGPGGWLQLSNKYVVISGCRDMQTSKERYFSEGSMKYKHGVLTYCLNEALMRAQPGSTYRDVFEQVSSKVPSLVNGQNPQIEGRLDRELFGTRDIEPLNGLPVEKIVKNTLVLGGGAAHGVRVGSRWALYPPGTKSTEASKPIANVTIAKVGGLRAEALLPKNRKGIAAGCRASLQADAVVPDPLSIDLEKLSASDRAQLESSIERSRLLTVASNASLADCQVRVLQASEQVLIEENPPRYQGITNASWVVLDTDGKLASPVHAQSERNAVDATLSNLETLARYRRTLALDNPLSLLDVSVNIYKRSAADKLTLANGGTTVFGPKDSLVVEIKNNSVDQPVFFSILWLDSMHSVQQFYPPRKASEELQAGKTIRLGHGRRKLRPGLSDQYLGQLGLETCKVMFATQQTDFSGMSQQATRSASVTASGMAAFDAAYRGNKAGKISVNSKDDWQAVNRSIVLRRSRA